MVPLTGELFGQLAARISPSASGQEGARRWGAEASASTTVAYVSLGEFGDHSYDDATLWSDGKEVLSRVTLRAVLAHFRDQARFDLGNKPIDLETQRGEDAAERWAASAILKEFVGQSASPIPALTTALQHERANKSIRNHVRKFAAEALAKFGPSAKDAIPALIQILRTEEDFGLCLTAGSTLAAIGADAVPALAQILTDGKVREVERSMYGKLYPTVWALSKIGPSARGAVPALQKALSDENKYVRQTAAEALASIQAGNAP